MYTMFKRIHTGTLKTSLEFQWNLFRFSKGEIGPI
uniref:Uncharacterized protein n=1 Tax=Anguilla anguilla TaxID=7936 RepID=A0A0E9WTE4_ANGAN